MNANFAQHCTTAGAPKHRESVAPAMPAAPWRALSLAERACCCSAKPAVVAIMPPAAGRRHATDLLLCGHHFRASRQSLTEAGAAVFDGIGRRVRPEAAALVGAC
jgi:hypothetical protein